MGGLWDVVWYDDVDNDVDGADVFHDDADDEPDADSDSDADAVIIIIMLLIQATVLMATKQFRSMIVEARSAEGASVVPSPSRQ